MQQPHHVPQFDLWSMNARDFAAYTSQTRPILSRTHTTAIHDNFRCGQDFVFDGRLPMALGADFLKCFGNRFKKPAVINLGVARKIKSFPKRGRERRFQFT
jgi:hypothetical protein